ncbi:MAG TPA: ATP-binding cassette domain-containing protein [Planctomycetota bacterium]
MAVPLLHGEGLRIERGGRVLLEGVAVGLAAGESADLEGPSGCGKSTLLRVLARLLPHAAGVLRLAGRTSAEVPAPEWRQGVAYVAQRPAALPGSVRDNLLAPWRLQVRRGQTGPSEAALRERLAAWRLDLDLAAPAAATSGGELARLAILRACLPGPRVLLLDEPEAMLDEVSAVALEDALAVFVAAGGAVLRAVHRARRPAVRRLRIRAGALEAEA